MGDSDDNLLDLSSWPAPPPLGTLPLRPGLPPRPVRARAARWFGLSLPRAAAALATVGGALVLLPVGDCGPAARAWTASTQPAPRDTAPQLDDAEVARDAAAVTAAQQALAASQPGSPSAPAASHPAAQPVPSATTRIVAAADPAEVARDRREVASAQREADAAQQDLDRVLAEQEASSDPGAYDAQVAAARERLEQAVAVLDDARRRLAAATARTRTVAVPAPAPAPAPSSTPAEPTATPMPGTPRAALVADLDEARQVQAAHLAARERAVADWRAGYEAQVQQVAAHNARVRSCARRAAVPAGSGTTALLLAGGTLAAHLVRTQHQRRSPRL